MARAWSAAAIALLSALLLASCLSEEAPRPSSTPSPSSARPAESPISSLPNIGGGTQPPLTGSAHESQVVPPPSSTPEPSSQPTLPNIDEKLDAYAAECERTVGKFKSGQVDYPHRLSLAMSHSDTYVAAVDIRTTPAPPSQVIGSDSATGEPVTVRCVVGARLSPVGGGIDVAATSDASDDGWRYQEFTPSGLLKWAWTITASAPYDHQVRLEVRPAAKGQDVTTVDTSDTVPFVTDVHVSADWIQTVSYWFQTEWPLIVGIATPIGVALGALFTFSEKTRDSFRTLFRPRRRESAKAQTTARGRRGSTKNNDVRATDKGTQASAHQTAKAPAAHAPPRTNRKT